MCSQSQSTGDFNRMVRLMLTVESKLAGACYSRSLLGTRPCCFTTPHQIPVEAGHAACCRDTQGPADLVCCPVRHHTPCPWCSRQYLACACFAFVSQRQLWEQTMLQLAVLLPCCRPHLVSALNLLLIVQWKS